MPKKRKLKVSHSKTRLIIVVDPPLNFASKLYESIQANILKWATGEGSFVVVALLEALSGKEKDAMIAQLKKSKKSLTDQARDNKGTKIVLENIE